MAGFDRCGHDAVEPRLSIAITGAILTARHFVKPRPSPRRPHRSRAGGGRGGRTGEGCGTAPRKIPTSVAHAPTLGRARTWYERALGRHHRPTHAEPKRRALPGP